MNKTWVNFGCFVYFWARLGHRTDLFAASMLRSPVIFVVSEIPGHERDMDGDAAGGVLISVRKWYLPSESVFDCVIRQQGGAIACRIRGENFSVTVINVRNFE